MESDRAKIILQLILSSIDTWLESEGMVKAIVYDLKLEDNPHI